jgi:hypothetical protein
LCLPTAPVLPLKETETSVGPRFLGNSRTSYCWPFEFYVGPPDVKHKDWWRNKAPNLLAALRNGDGTPHLEGIIGTALKPGVGG